MFVDAIRLEMDEIRLDSGSKLESLTKKFRISKSSSKTFWALRLQIRVDRKGGWFGPHCGREAQQPLCP